MTDSVVLGIVYGIPPVLIGVVMLLWSRIHRNEIQIEELRERNDRTEEALESYLLPATQTVGMLTDRVRNLENELTRHMEEPHMPLDPGEARRAAREARARQRAIEEDLGG
jgi:hypothetical protein